MIAPRSVMLCVALALALPLAATAQDLPARKEPKRVDLDGGYGMEVVRSITAYKHKRGDVRAAHLRHGIEAGYVVQGAMVQMPGKEPTMLLAGAAVMNLRDAMHASFPIVGETPLTLFTVHIVDKGRPPYDVAK